MTPISKIHETEVEGGAGYSETSLYVLLEKLLWKNLRR